MEEEKEEEEEKLEKEEEEEEIAFKISHICYLRELNRECVRCQLSFINHSSSHSHTLYRNQHISFGTLP